MEDFQEPYNTQKTYVNNQPKAYCNANESRPVYRRFYRHLASVVLLWHFFGDASSEEGIESNGTFGALPDKDIWSLLKSWDFVLPPEIALPKLYKESTENSFKMSGLLKGRIGERTVGFFQVGEGCWIWPLNAV